MGEAELHRYRAATRCIPVAVTIVWMIGGIGFLLLHIHRAEAWPEPDKQIYFWAPWLVLMALGLWGQLSYNKRLKPIEVTDEGIWVGDRRGHAPRLIPWEKIERAARVHGYSSSRGIIPNRAGVYVWADGRPLVIHEQIGGFDALTEKLRREFSRRGIAIEG